MDLQYLLYDLGDSNGSSVTSRAFPTSKRAILFKRGSNNRESAVSSSRRLPTSIGGLWGLLGKTVEHLDSFSDAPKRAPRAVSGLFFRLPTFSAVL